MSYPKTPQLGYPTSNPGVLANHRQVNVNFNPSDTYRYKEWRQPASRGLHGTTGLPYSHDGRVGCDQSPTVVGSWHRHLFELILCAAHCKVLMIHWVKLFHLFPKTNNQYGYTLVFLSTHKQVWCSASRAFWCSWLFFGSFVIIIISLVTARDTYNSLC